jgi:hypothetical protein
LGASKRFFRRLDDELALECPAMIARPAGRRHGCTTQGNQPTSNVPTHGIVRRGQAGRDHLTVQFRGIATALIQALIEIVPILHQRPRCGLSIWERIGLEVTRHRFTIEIERHRDLTNRLAGRVEFVNAVVVLNLLLPLGLAGLLTRRELRHLGFIGYGNILKCRKIEFGSRRRLAFQVLLNGLTSPIEQAFGGSRRFFSRCQRSATCFACGAPPDAALA